MNELRDALRDQVLLPDNVEDPTNIVYFGVDSPSHGQLIVRPLHVVHIDSFSGQHKLKRIEGPILQNFRMIPVIWD